MHPPASITQHGLMLDGESDLTDHMTAKVPQPAESHQVLGLLAQYSSPAALVAAARECRERGYRQLEAFSPFPVHGLDDALGAHPTRLPWAVLLMAIAGGVGALLLQWWTNAIDYPFLISGKPRFSLPANIPVIFEVVILSAALVSFFGMLAANGLPKLSNQLLRDKQFLRDDRPVLSARAGRRR